MNDMNGIVRGQQEPQHKASGKVPTKGFHSTLVSDENFEWMKSIQREFPDPWIDLKYISDGAITLLRQTTQAEVLERLLLVQARESIRTHLQKLNESIT
jgi:hypothetical protein